MIRGQQKKTGFTLIELLVSVAIISILVAIGVLTYNGARAQARDSKRVEDLKSIATALEAYYNQFGKYPDNADSNDVGCWGAWDGGNSELNGASDPFLDVLVTGGFMSNTPKEKHTVNQSDTWSQCSYRYIKSGIGTGESAQAYAVLYARLEKPRTVDQERPACADWGEGASGDPNGYMIAKRE